MNVIFGVNVSTSLKNHRNARHPSSIIPRTFLPAYLISAWTEVKITRNLGDEISVLKMLKINRVDAKKNVIRNN